MGQVLVSNLDDAVIERLKARAADNHRSLEAELREILENAARRVNLGEIRQLSETVRRRLHAIPSHESARLLTAD